MRSIISEQMLESGTRHSRRGYKHQNGSGVLDQIFPILGRAFGKAAVVAAKEGPGIASKLAQEAAKTAGKTAANRVVDAIVAKAKGKTEEMIDDVINIAGVPSGTADKNVKILQKMTSRKPDPYTGERYGAGTRKRKIGKGAKPSSKSKFASAFLV